MDRKPGSSAEARAPWLRMVQPADTSPAPVSQGRDGQGLVLASFAMPSIDERGARASAFIRMVAWLQDNGRWALGVLEEKWPDGQLGQGDPASFRLWQVSQEFNLRDMAQAQVDFWSKNKTVRDIRRQLLGHREFYEDVVAPPPLVADSARGQELPFERPALKSRKNIDRDAIPRVQ